MTQKDEFSSLEGDWLDGDRRTAECLRRTPTSCAGSPDLPRFPCTCGLDLRLSWLHARRPPPHRSCAHVSAWRADPHHDAGGLPARPYAVEPVSAGKRHLTRNPNGAIPVSAFVGVPGPHTTCGATRARSPAPRITCSPTAGTCTRTIASNTFTSKARRSWHRL